MRPGDLLLSRRLIIVDKIRILIPFFVVVVVVVRKNPFISSLSVAIN